MCVCVCVCERERERESLYVTVSNNIEGICVIKTNLMHYLSSVYFVTQPLHVSGIFATHHQEVYCIYTTVGMCCAFRLTVCWSARRQSTEKHNTYQFLYIYIHIYIYSIPPDDGLKMCPKHVEVDG